MRPDFAIVATLGPASFGLARELAGAGATAFRLNASHLSPDDLARLGAEEEPFTGFGHLQPSAGRVGIGIPDEEDRLAFVTDHAEGQVMRGGVLAHHAGGDHENAAPGEFHVVDLTLVEDDEIQRVVQLQIGVLAVGPVRFQVVDFREHSAEAADVDRLRLELAFAHHDGEVGKDLLGAAQGEGRNKD